MVDDEKFTIDLDGADRDFLLLHYGQFLFDIEYLIRRMAQRKYEKSGIIHVDSRKYRVHLPDDLTSMADNRANKVIETGRSERLPMLYTYARWVIHNHLSDHPKVVTSSEGQR